MFDLYDMENYNEKNEEIDQFIKNRTVAPIELSELKVGQTVVVYFNPYSQKYIHILTPKIGKIVQISKTYDLDEYQILCFDSNEPEKLFHNGVSYIGNDLGYTFNIDLIQ